MKNEGIRVAIGQFHDLTDEKLRFAAQIGVKGIQMNNPRLPGDQSWEYKDIKALVDKTRKHGLGVRGDRKRPDPLLQQGHARPARPRRADRELPEDAAQHRPRRHPDPRLPLHAEFGLADRAAGAGARRRRRDQVRHGRDRGQDEAPVAQVPADDPRPLHADLRRERRHRHGGSDVRQLQVFHRGGAAGRGGGRREAGAPSRRSARPHARRRRAHLQGARRLQARLAAQSQERRAGGWTSASAAARRCRAARPMCAR